MTYVKQCRQCKKEFGKNPFTSLKTWNDVTQFCSLVCKQIASRNRVTIICKQCSKKIERPKSIQHRTLCSIACRDAYWKLHPEESSTFKNGHVGIKSTPWLGKKFSKQHRENIRQGIITHPNFAVSMRNRALKLRGTNHWNWRGGITESNKIIRHSAEYNTWRKAVYERDAWTCQDCHIKQKRPVAHHILSFEDYPDLRFEVSNGVTLCRACHNQRHRDIKQFFGLVRSEAFAALLLNN